MIEFECTLLNACAVFQSFYAMNLFLKFMVSAAPSIVGVFFDQDKKELTCIACGPDATEGELSLDGTNRALQRTGESCQIVGWEAVPLTSYTRSLSVNGEVYGGKKPECRVWLRDIACDNYDVMRQLTIDELPSSTLFRQFVYSENYVKVWKNVGITRTFF